MATNYAQLEKMMLTRYKCTSVEIAERIYKGRTDITDVIRAIADMNQCKDLFEKHKNLCAVRDGEAFKGSIGKAGAIDLLKRVVANWIAQDLFIRNLNKNKINCELGKFHRDRAFEGCLSVEPTAILWAGERMKSRHRLMDVQIVYGNSMEDGLVTLKKEKFLKLIEKKAILLTMNMTTLKYSLVDFYTTDTVCEEFILNGSMHIVKIALQDSKCALNKLGMVREHIEQVISNTIGADAVKVTEPQANFIAVFEVEKDGKSKKLVKTYSIPEDALDKRIAQAKANTDSEVKEVAMKSESSAVPTAKPTPIPTVVPKAVQTPIPTVVSKPTANVAVQQKPTTPKPTVQTTAPIQKPTPKPVAKPIPKPVQKPIPQHAPQVEEEDNGGYDFSALDSFA